MSDDTNAPVEMEEQDTSGITFEENPLDGLADVFTEDGLADEGAEEPEAETEEEPEAEEEAEGPRASKSILLAAKKEKELRAKQQEFKEQYEKWEQEKEQYAKVQELMANAHKDPLAYLQAAGLDLNTLSDYIINNTEQVKKQKPAELAAIEKKIEQLEQQQLEKQQREQELLQQEQERLLEQFETSVYNFVENNEYPAIKALEGQSIVIDVIQRHAAETGAIMDYNDACSQVEEALMERIQQIKLVTPQAIESKTTNDVAETPSTLSNDMVSDTGVKGERELTDEEAERLANQWIMENVG